ncbi:metallophosphoesterase family protein [Sphingopyxis sp.]|uniref:metallophosphoesterase family protein n=1 Tax=Sphingopyxis sp. TaxID=1908224 RepID=UPI003D0D9A5B
MRIAVISDIHAAFKPFAQGLADARSAGFDQLVLLGDLFTYGLEPRECADLAAEAMAKDGAVLVRGNHDQLYIDLERGVGDYFDRLPDWIRESVEWTWNSLSQQWPRSLSSVDEWATGDLLMAHANPFGYGDWTYLSDEATLGRAAKVCATRGYRHGIFGHLHRQMHHATRDCEIHVIGSIGQPRSRDDPSPHWAMVETTDHGIKVTRHDVRFDTAGHCAAVKRHPAFSDSTKQKLCGFFE